MIIIERTNEIASCNSCSSCNYENKMNFKKVDCIYNVTFRRGIENSGMRVCLCKQCLRKLGVNAEARIMLDGGLDND